MVAISSDVHGQGGGEGGEGEAFHWDPYCRRRAALSGGCSSGRGSSGRRIQDGGGGSSRCCRTASGGGSSRGCGYAGGCCMNGSRSGGCDGRWNGRRCEGWICECRMTATRLDYGECEDGKADLMSYPGTPLGMIWRVVVSALTAVASTNATAAAARTVNFILDTIDDCRKLKLWCR